MAKLQFERRQGEKAAVAAAVVEPRKGRGGRRRGPTGRHTMERAADQRSGEIELEIFHSWLA